MFPGPKVRANSLFFQVSRSLITSQAIRHKTPETYFENKFLDHTPDQDGWGGGVYSQIVELGRKLRKDIEELAIF